MAIILREDSQEVVAAEPESTGKVVDLMKALGASAEKAKKEKESA